MSGKPKTLADALAEVPGRKYPTAIRARLEAAGLADQVLEARRNGESFARIVKALQAFDVKVGTSSLADFCRANEVD